MGSLPRSAAPFRHLQPLLPFADVAGGCLSDCTNDAGSSDRDGAPDSQGERARASDGTGKFYRSYWTYKTYLSHQTPWPFRDLVFLQAASCSAESTELQGRRGRFGLARDGDERQAMPGQQPIQASRKGACGRSKS